MALLSRRLKLLTYNIHSGVGTDRRYSLDRIGQILAEEQPDIAALQEIDCDSAGGCPDQASSLAAHLGVTSSFCATRPGRKGGSFGIAVLSRFPVVFQRAYDLSYRPRREPRFCMRVDLEIEPGAILHVFNCHLGLATRERAWQRKQMLSDAILLSENLQNPVILMGDFNDSPIPVVHRRLRRHFKDAFRSVGRRWGPTFHLGPLPLRLDYIYVSPRIEVAQCFVRRDRLAKAASDHRPVVAIVDLTWA